MLCTVLNKSLKQHPKKQQLYSHLPPISQTIQARWIRHVGHCCKNKDKLISSILLWAWTHKHTSVGQPAGLITALSGHWMQSRRPAKREALYYHYDENDFYSKPIPNNVEFTFMENKFWKKKFFFFNPYLLNEILIILIIKVFAKDPSTVFF